MFNDNEEVINGRLRLKTSFISKKEEYFNSAEQ